MMYCIKQHTVSKAIGKMAEKSKQAVKLGGKNKNFSRYSKTPETATFK